MFGVVVAELLFTSVGNHQVHLRMRGLIRISRSIQARRP